jgi:hypothetical protein
MPLTRQTGVNITYESNKSLYFFMLIIGCFSRRINFCHFIPIFVIREFLVFVQRHDASLIKPNLSKVNAVKVRAVLEKIPER